MDVDIIMKVFMKNLHTKYDVGYFRCYARYDDDDMT